MAGLEVELLSNLEAIGDMVGGLAALSEGLDDKLYMEGLIKSAHGKASTVFDAAAAATAKTGHITHVYEYGVMGVTRGAPKFADPTNIRARLYYHTLMGSGGNQDIGYSFRPATQPNPTPTTQDTGVDSKYLNKLSNRKYYFYNKAFILETGRVIEIKPQNGNFLFVPFYGEPPRNPMYNRGFIMWDARKKGPLYSQPGYKTEGDFTKFWLGWWQSTGQAVMSDIMEEYVTIDTEAAIAEATKKAESESMKPVQETSLVGAANATRAWVVKFLKARSAKRRETKTR